MSGGPNGFPAAEYDCSKTADPMIELASDLLGDDPEVLRLPDLEHNLSASVILVHRGYTNATPPPALGEKVKHRGSKACMEGKCSWSLEGSLQRWTNQPSFALCSGVLVARDVVLTAKHCACYFEHLSDVRIQSADWQRGDTREWRSVKAVMGPSSVRAPRNPCIEDFVFLKLDEELGVEPVRPRSRDSSAGRETSYMVASPLGIPGVVSQGRVDLDASGDVCSKHDMYAAVNSSGGVIFGSDGDFIGLNSRPLTRCNCPRVAHKKLWFPEPNPESWLGRYIPFSSDSIATQLSNGQWVPVQDYRRVCKDNKGKEFSLDRSSVDWQC